MLEAGTNVPANAWAVKSSPLVKIEMSVKVDVTVKEETTEVGGPEAGASSKDCCRIDFVRAQSAEMNLRRRDRTYS